LDDKGNLDYLAGVEVSSSEGLPAEFMHLSIAPGRYAVFGHAGHISSIGRTWMDIFETWLPKSGFAPAPAPGFECTPRRSTPL
jgi:AraC family transcriptional regulator